MSSNMFSRILTWLVQKMIGKYDDEKAETDVWFCMKKLIIVFLLKYVLPKREKEVGVFTNPLQDFNKSGMFATEKEWEKEMPKLSSALDYKRDSLSFYGGNTKGDRLYVEFVSFPENKGEVTLFLHLADGDSYVLENYPETKTFHTDKNGFSGEGLKLICLDPFRKWKINFNGRLKNLKSKIVIHTKFCFVWSPTSMLNETPADTHYNLKANVLSHGDTGYVIQNKRLLDSLEIYEQCGMFIGSLTLQGENEKELIMWGLKERNRTEYNTKDQDDKIQFFGMLKNGKCSSVGAMNYGCIKNFQYGFMNFPNRKLHSIHSTNVKSNSTIDSLTHTLKIQADTHYQSWSIVPDEEIAVYSSNTNSCTTISFANFTLKDDVGHGIVKKTIKISPRTNSSLDESTVILVEKDVKTLKKISLILNFDDEACQSSEVAGGKGCSLALLKKFSKINKQFTVPNGIVLSTTAYSNHLKHHPHLSHLISELQYCLGTKDVKQLKENCSKIETAFKGSTLSPELEQQVKLALDLVFKIEIDSIRFAIRSSAIGEDGEDTSFAGQLSTILGARGYNKIYKSICDCWGSQFSFIAVQYKRQNGLRLNPGMAIVIQEMVPAEIAGVTFTCDPITGDPGKIITTANYGLGESIVSAASEPDTIICERKVGGVLAIESKTVGRKGLKMSMNERDGTKEECPTSEESLKMCLDDHSVLKLSNICLKVEKAFNSPRDIEWAMTGSKLYLLQSRPVTTINQDNDYTITHELDYGFTAEFEYITRANVGEVMPGTISPLSMATYMRGVEIYFSFIKRKEKGDHYVVNPYSPTVLTFSHGQCFINILEFSLKETDDSGLLVNRVFDIAFFGRFLEDYIVKASIERNGIYKRPPVSALKTLLRTIKTNLQSDRIMKRASHLKTDHLKTSCELFRMIKINLELLFEGYLQHLFALETSSVFNMFLIQKLADHYDDNIADLLKDVALLLSDCNIVDSADVPKSLQKMAIRIVQSSQIKDFSKMDLPDAIRFLQNDKGIVGQDYKQFVDKHSHRCLKEFDYRSTSWGESPDILVKTLQVLASNPNLKDIEVKKGVSTWDAVNSLNYKPNFKTKLELCFLVYCARFGVMVREQNKSLIIKYIDIFRRPFKRLGLLMTQEGKLTDPQQVFYLTFEELQVLATSHSSSLSQKAKRRQKIYAKLEHLKFPEICSGLPHSLNDKKIVNGKEDSRSNVMLKGITVSQGVVRGKAKVILNYSECSQIEMNDILITYSTDVGYAPYFPLLSGIVTEIGGLISHGAVVAREYGIPCLVGVQGATDTFKSGDYVILDTTLGVIKKVLVE